MASRHEDRIIHGGGYGPEVEWHNNSCRLGGVSVVQVKQLPIVDTWGLFLMVVINH